MRTKRLEYFSNFFLDISDEEIEFMLSELREAGIDPEQSEARIKYLIKKTKAQIKIEKGKILQEKIKNVIREKVDYLLPQKEAGLLAVQFRKMDKIDREDIETIKKDKALLNDIEKIIGEND